MLNLAIAGCQGRMGQALIQCALTEPQLKLTAATIKPGTTAQPIGPSQIKPQDDLAKIINDFTVLIDFTAPEATMHHLQCCKEFNKKLVIGTTGLSDAQKKQIQAASEQIAIVYAPNMSIGVNMMYALLAQAATVMKGADIEVIEAHHKHKKDAPSGTALKMGEVICGALNTNMKDVAVYERQSKIEARDPKSIGFSSIRAGDIVGDHTVIFAQDGERLEITHRASNRNNFAQGAIRAALWLQNKQTGLFDMQDVLFR